MTSQQDQQSEISTPAEAIGEHGGTIDEPAAGGTGHAFWRAVRGRDTETEPEEDGSPADDAGLSESAEARPDAEAAAGGYAGPDPDRVSGADLAGPPAAVPAEAADSDPDDTGELDDEIIVAEVIDVSPGQPVTGAQTTTADTGEEAGIAEADDEGVIAEPAVAAADETAAAAAATAPDGGRSPATGQAAAGTTASTDLGPRWHDIQATFVDDPRGAVQLAADTADAALNELIDSLRARQSTLSTAAGASSPDNQDTERLRAELREYRTLCHELAEVQRRLGEPQAA